MKPLSTEQAEFLRCCKHGVELQVATSEYSYMNGGPGTQYPATWRPVWCISAASLRGLVARGLVKAEFFWRGANVTIL